MIREVLRPLGREHLLVGILGRHPGHGSLRGKLGDEQRLRRLQHLRDADGALLAKAAVG